MQQAARTDTQYRNLILETAMAGLDAPEQSRIQLEINSAFKALMQPARRSWQLEMTGVPVFAAATQQLVQGDITQVSILSSLALMALFLLLFRSLGALLQVFSVIDHRYLGAILTTAWVFGYVHGMTVAIGSTLIGICIDYPIHAVAHAQTVRDEDKTAAIVKIWPSMLLGGVTTLVGYAALGASGYPGFQQIAVYAGCRHCRRFAANPLHIAGLDYGRFLQAAERCRWSCYGQHSAHVSGPGCWPCCWRCWAHRYSACSRCAGSRICRT